MNSRFLTVLSALLCVLWALTDSAVDALQSIPEHDQAPVSMTARRIDVVGPGTTQGHGANFLVEQNGPGAGLPPLPAQSWDGLLRTRFRPELPPATPRAQLRYTADSGSVSGGLWMAVGVVLTLLVAVAWRLISAHWHDQLVRIRTVAEAQVRRLRGMTAGGRSGPDSAELASWRDLAARIRWAFLQRLTKLRSLGRRVPDQSEEQQRIVAVAQLRDQSLLARIAATDASSAVQQAALDRVTNEQLLARVAESGTSSLTYEAVQRIEDQRLLGQIARGKSTERLAALHRIYDQQVLGDVAKYAEETTLREEAVARLEDEAVLAGIAKEDGSTEIRCLALGRLQDQYLMAEALRDGPPELLEAADVELIDDPALYAMLAEQAKDPGIRLKFVRLLDDQVALAEVASSDQDRLVRSAAVELLEDQDALEYIARNDSHMLVRRIAVQRLQNQAALAHVALHDRVADVRSCAVQRLENQAALAQVAAQETKEVVRRAAVRKLQDPQLLVRLLREDPDEQVQQLAVGGIDDGAILLEVAKTHPRPSVGLSAVRRLQDQGSLLDVAEHASDPQVRGEAAAKLVQTTSELGVVGKLAPHLQDEAVGREVVSRLIQEQQHQALLEVALHSPLRGLRLMAAESVEGEVYLRALADARGVPHPAAIALLRLARRGPLECDAETGVVRLTSDADLGDELTQRIRALGFQVASLARSEWGYCPHCTEAGNAACPVCGGEVTINKEVFEVTIAPRDTIPPQDSSPPPGADPPPVAG